MAKHRSVKIVSNTGPIIGLAKIRQLGLLKKLAPKICIPPSAKEKGLIEKVSPLVDELREKGYWLSEEVIRISKKLAKE